jgi:hypothetical protein
MVKPSRLQSDFGPREWATTEWATAPVQRVDEACTTASGNGTILRAMIPVTEVTTGELHYKAMVSTLSGADLYQYPANGDYYTLDITYRAAFGSFFGAMFMFTVVGTFVWGGLAVSLRIMLNPEEDEVLEAELRSIYVGELD